VSCQEGLFSIHSEVKEAKIMKATVVVWVPEWNKTKRGKTMLLSLSFFFIYLCIVKHKIVECMYG